MAVDETYTVGIQADTSALDKALGDMTVRANTFGSALNAALRGAVVGGQSLDGVLRQLALRISTIALNTALKPVTSIAGGLIGQLAGGLGSLLGGEAGAGAGKVMPFAKGGVVASPSFFPNGRQIGLMGEAGAEAVLPLKRGPDGTLGVAAGGERRGGSNIVFNVSTNDAASFRRSESQIQAMLARAADRGRRGL